ncbi:MAG: hypothetical protein CM1200mP30_32870 [Pseudomonadota bacterium]|nr:MAG: hypothetical protein CM1200mP30_32870 [Pseudomonadota bacterium]
MTLLKGLVTFPGNDFHDPQYLSVKILEQALSGCQQAECLIYPGQIIDIPASFFADQTYGNHSQRKSPALREFFCTVS